MEYYFKQHQVRRYLRKHRETSEEEIVTVSNVNGLPVEKHMELLNMNDSEYEYLEYLGDSDIE